MLTMQIQLGLLDIQPEEGLPITDIVFHLGYAAEERIGFAGQVWWIQSRSATVAFLKSWAGVR